MPKLWRLARLFLLTIALTLLARYELNWSPPAAAVARAALGLAEICLLSLILSPRLARLLAIGVLFPMYAAVILDAFFYGVGLWVARGLGDQASPRMTAALALLLELVLILAMANLIMRP